MVLAFGSDHHTDRAPAAFNLRAAYAAFNRSVHLSAVHMTLEMIVALPVGNHEADALAFKLSLVQRQITTGHRCTAADFLQLLFEINLISALAIGHHNLQSPFAG